jgi:hypothetical protein
MWACDDTRFTCAPICIQTAGKVTVQVQKSLCTKPVDPCLCNEVCYYDVHWDKPRGEIQCLASQNGTKKMVADLVCEFRGAKKPTDEEWNSGKVVKGTRGTFPENLDQCWKKPGQGTDSPQFTASFGARVWLAAIFWLLA